MKGLISGCSIYIYIYIYSGHNVENEDLKCGFLDAS